MAHSIGDGIMFIALGEIFEYDGVKLIAGNVPRHFWPCQNCALYEKCCTDYGLPGFPECQANRRKDSRDIVFFEWFGEPVGKPRRDRR